MKNKSIMLYTSVAMALVVLLGCASAELEREQRQQIRAQPPADSPQEIMQRASAAFSNAPGLTPEQKTKLSAVYSQVYADAMEIRREMGQAKSLLFSKLASVNYKNKEIVNLKNRIVKLDQRRLDLMFNALGDVQKIVGTGDAAEKIYKHFEDHEVPRTRYDAAIE